MFRLQLRRYCFFLLFVFVTPSRGHFVLHSPPPLGAFNDATEETGPCGGYEMTTRDHVTSFPVAGYPIHVLTVHNSAILEYRVALANDTTAWINLITPIRQIGRGDYCLPAVPGYAPWAGLDTVLQVVQWAPDGPLYQCAAIVFSTGSAAAATSDCKNSTGVIASAVAFTSSIQRRASATTIVTSIIAASTSSTAVNSTASQSANKTSTVPSASKAASSAVHGLGYYLGGKIWWLIVMILGPLALMYGEILSFEAVDYVATSGVLLQVDLGNDGASSSLSSRDTGSSNHLTRIVE